MIQPLVLSTSSYIRSSSSDVYGYKGLREVLRCWDRDLKRLGRGHENGDPPKIVLPYPPEFFRLHTLVALENVVDTAYKDTLSFLHGKERSAACKELSAFMAKMEEIRKTVEICPPTTIFLGSKRVQDFSLEGVTDQGITYKDPTMVHVKITSHFTDW